MTKRLSKADVEIQQRKLHAERCINVRDKSRNNSPEHRLACKLLHRVRQGNLLTIEEQVMLNKALIGFD